MSRRLVLSLIAVLAAAACAGPGATPASVPASAAATPAAVPPAASQAPSISVATPAATPKPTIAIPWAFTSPLYGYTLTLPAGWFAGPAMLRWDGEAQTGHEEPEADRFGGPPTASAWAFAGPVTLDLAGFVKDRIAANKRDHSDFCPPTPDVNEPIQFGGKPGVFLAWNCGLLINQAIIVRKGIAFTLLLRDPAIHAATDPGDRALLEELLNSMIFPK